MNYSVLERNVLGSLQTEAGQSAFMWARSLPELSDDVHGYRAEEFAREVEKLAEASAVCLGIASRKLGHPITRAQRQDLWEFMMARHAFWRFPGRKTAYKMSAMPSGKQP